MATQVTPHFFNHQPSASRSGVKVPNSRTETVSRPSGTATMCRSEPMSIPAALRLMCCRCEGSFGRLILFDLALFLCFDIVSSSEGDPGTTSELAGAGKQEFAFFLTGY